MNRSIRTALIPGIGAVAAICIIALRPSSAATIGNGPLVIQVDPTTGAQSIVLNNVAMGSGTPAVTDANNIFDVHAVSVNPQGTATVVSQLTQISPVAVEIIEKTGNLDVDLVETCEGEDLTFKAKITNSSAVRLNIACIGGLNLQFPAGNAKYQADLAAYRASSANHPTTQPAPNPAGYISGTVPAWHYTYLQRDYLKNSGGVGIGICHPSTFCVFGGEYETDGVYGVGLYSASHLQRRALIQAVFGAGANSFSPVILAEVNTNQNETSYLDFTIRISRSKDPFHLLQGYRDTFQAQMGPMQYTPDDRPISRLTPSANSEKNPYGLAIRYDTMQGVWQMNAFAPRLAGIFQSTIVWSWQGLSPRGGNYRPDFDILPDPIAQNVPAIVSAWKASGVALGTGSRPGDVLWDYSPTADFTFHPGAGSAFIDALLARLKNAQTLGFGSCYYCDSFPNGIDDLETLRQMRRQLGPNVPLYDECGSDLALVYAGRYAQYNGDGSRSISDYEIAMDRWLVPGCSIAIYGDRSIFPKQAAAFYAAHWTPIVELVDTPVLAPVFAPLNAANLENNHWKN